MVSVSHSRHRLCPSEPGVLGPKEHCRSRSMKALAASKTGWPVVKEEDKSEKEKSEKKKKNV